MTTDLITEPKFVTYEVDLQHPSCWVQFEGPDGLSEGEILDMAIEEMLQKTSIASYRVKV